MRDNFQYFNIFEISKLNSRQEYCFIFHSRESIDYLKETGIIKSETGIIRAFDDAFDWYKLTTNDYNSLISIHRKRDLEAVGFKEVEFITKEGQMGLYEKNTDDIEEMRFYGEVEVWTVGIGSVFGVKKNDKEVPGSED